VTAGVSAATAATVGRLSSLDPSQAAVRRAVRVTVAACLAFYPLRYGLGDPTTAVYAVFSAISLGALSDVQGAPASRTRTYLAALVAGGVLVTAGTLAAVSTAVAAAGMLVVGFVVAFAGIGGTRVAGVANGLQLFYLLPCFPPFAPDTLDQRLTGLAVGGLLLAAADRLVLPTPGPPPPGHRLADAVDRIAAYAAALRPVLRDDTAASGEELAARRAALDAAARLRLADVPMAQRPLGPGVRDRSLLAASAATRVTAGRLAALDDLVAERGATPHPRTADLVGATADAFTELARALRSGDPVPVSTAGLDAALERYLAERADHLAGAARPASDLRAGLAAVAVAEEARIAVVAAGGFLGVPPPDPATVPRTLWFLHAGWTELVWRRLRAHLTPRSVYLQNAARLALGLAAARVVAGVLDLSHGFWVLLATLSLMRTSAVAGRAVLPRAFAGTMVGALVSAALLALVGTSTEVYAWALPLVMLLAFAAGPVLGVAAGQAGFTVVVAMLFAQVAPTDWQLAEVRLTDVVVGGLVGAVIGAVVWPRGGGGEVRRAAAAGLRAGAATVRDTVAQLAGARPAASESLHRLASLFEQAYVQFRTEPPGAPGPDWLVVLMVVSRIDNYASMLRARHAAGEPPPATATAPLLAAAAEVAAGYAAVADAIGAGEPPATGTAATLQGLLDRAGPPAVSGEREATLRLVDGWGWLLSLVDDLDRLEQACAPRVTGAG
jgi:uncharacterized membrane protein YccC